MGKQDNRRGYSRARERLITFVKDPATGRVHRTLTRDLGGVGVCVVTDEMFEPGQSLELELQLPDRKEPVTATGQVVWNKPTEDTVKGSRIAMREIGIKYTKLSAKDLAFIQQHIAMNAPPDW